MGEVIWETRMTNLCWMFASFAFNSARACSRAVSHSLSIECKGSLLGSMV